MIKAIETWYKGFKFRSRNEARYAVGFDAAGIEWRYENEGYVLPNGTPYLPDFYLPEFDMYVEIKGSNVMAKPASRTLYLAGKMGTLRCYRTPFSFELHAHNQVIGPVDEEWHGSEAHGTNDWDDSHSGATPSVSIRSRCFKEIRQADDFVAYITADDAYGTICEIGYAMAILKPVHVAFSSELDRDVINDMWFSWKRDDGNEPIVARKFLDAYRRMFPPTGEEKKMQMLCEGMKKYGMMLGDAFGGEAVSFLPDGDFHRGNIIGKFRDKLQHVQMAAKSARFEHGERGAAS